VDRHARGVARVIAVIGGGWAGCAAAVEVARGGFRVILHEASAALGGRARSVVRDGLPLDNGEHLLLGAYAETRRLVALLHQDDAQSPWIARPLAIRPFAQGQRHAITLRAHKLPAPIGLLTGVLNAVGLSWSERIATVRWFARQRREGFRCRADATVDELLCELAPGVRRALWEPLCLAALNTRPQRASAQIFLNVLRETFDGASDAATMLTPRVGLGEIVPERAARWLSARGQCVHRSSRVQIVDTPDGVRVRSEAGE
jgi:predicted NAD/FAD-binding protein